MLLLLVSSAVSAVLRVPVVVSSSCARQYTCVHLALAYVAQVPCPFRFSCSLARGTLFGNTVSTCPFVFGGSSGRHNVWGGRGVGSTGLWGWLRGKVSVVQRDVFRSAAPNPVSNSRSMRSLGLPQSFGDRQPCGSSRVGHLCSQVHRFRADTSTWCFWRLR